MLQAANRQLALLCNVLSNVFGRLFVLLRPLARRVVGSWHPPHWLRLAGTFSGRGLSWLQRRLAGLLLILMVAGVAVIASPHVLRWWHGLTPDRVTSISTTAKIEPPDRTRIETDSLPDPVVLQFSASVAPLASIGKEAVGPSIEPAIEGRWTWPRTTGWNSGPRETGRSASTTR